MKLKPEEIFEELKGYCIVKNKKNMSKIPQWSSIKYIDKDKGEYRRGGLLFSTHLDKGYIVLQSVYTKRGKPIRWSVQWKNSVIFYRDAEKK
jgi:hypothetical protein